jgi:hypothetical protein
VIELSVTIRVHVLQVKMNDRKTYSEDVLCLRPSVVECHQKLKWMYPPAESDLDPQGQGMDLGTPVVGRSI